MNQERWLISSIESAFLGVSLGDGMDLYAAQSRDDYGNPEEDELSLTAERDDWRRVPKEDLFPRFWAVTFLDAAGFRFYTPAIMTVLLQPHDPGECLSSWFLLNLQPDSQGNLKGTPFDELFTSRQKASIIRFLKYIVHNRGRYFDVEDAARRLQELRRNDGGPRESAGGHR